MVALHFKRLLFTAGMVLAALVILSVPGYSVDIGFHATLDNPPAVVSQYDAVPQDFSVANPPMSYAPLSPQLIRKPKLLKTSYESKYLTFNTEYAPGKSLIPMGLTSDQFLNYRMAKYETEGFRRLGARIFAGQQGKQGQGGLSIGVNLPKRLNSVFGEGGGNLRVSGYRRVSFSGRSQWTDGVQSELLGRSKFPSLNMDQVYRFDIDGTIGSKISVHVAEDSQTDIPLANRLQLRYKGDDDDILRVIEAGNTNLSLPNTRFVGYSSRIQGLFGIKTEAQLGAFKLTAIASQEKGSSERASISASGDSTATRIRDYDFAEGRIYDLFYRGEKIKGGDTIQATDRIINLRVYEGQPYLHNVEYFKAFDTRMLINPDSLNDPNKETPRSEEIDRNLYNFYDDEKTNRHYVVFNSAHKDNALGAWIQLERHIGGRVDTVTIGNLAPPAPDDTLRLKMLRPSNPSTYTPSHPTWPLMWRNVYRIPQGATISDLNIKVVKGLEGSEGTSSALDDQRSASGTSEGKYVRILGLDQYDRQGALKRPDDVVDERIEIFRPDWGLLIFPAREPFNSDTTFVDGTGNQTAQLDEKVPTIYSYTSGNEKTLNSRYYIEYSSRSRSSIIRLNRANIIEGSERVTVNGRLLTRGPDYSIQYDFGQVTLLSQEALDPNAKVNIDFEYAPFLAIQKKSLFGARAEYAFSDDFRIGSTMLYKTDKAQDRKPRVGQETARMTVADFDGTFKLYPKFLTKAINALPLITTDAPSAITVAGELAQSRPNPNIDNVAYVDDFESALEQLNLPMSRGGWSLASRPGHLNILGHADPSLVRSKMLWHNVVGGERTDRIYDRDTKQGEGTTNIFRMVFRPKIKDIVRDSVCNVIDTIPTNSWAGIMTYFAGIDPYRVQLFEMRVRGTHGKIHFDFGRINEDVDGNDLMNTEDGITDPALKNRQLEPEEDRGLDGKADAQEPCYDPTTNPDPDGDDWYSQGKGKCPLPGGGCENNAGFSDPNNPLYYEYLNGTEGNMEDLASLATPDQEQLSGVVFEQQDAYFSYVVDLSDEGSLLNSGRSFYVKDSKNVNGWKTYRVPIRDSLAIDTTYSSQASVKPDWGQITHVRVWFEADSTVPPVTGVKEPDTVEVAAWYFVQSNWQDSLVTRRVRNDTTQFVVASVSTEDGTFTPPPGVEAYQDKTNNVTESQKGLGLIYNKVPAGDTCLAVKRLPSVDRYSGYGSLEMYVHGDPDAVSSTTNSDSILFFFRIGRDAKTFYEYRTYVHPGWDERNYVKMDFNEMTALKDRLLKSLPKNTPPDKVDSVVGSYRIKGNPNINEVQYFSAGVINLDPVKPATGKIWLDELRVSDVRRDVGVAARVEVMGNIADMGSYNFQWGSKNPYFRGISATTRGGSQDNLGSGGSENNYSFNMNLSMDKFLPRSLGAALPVSYSYSRSSRLPLLRTGTDIVLPEDVRILERSLATSKGFRASENFQRPGKNPLFSWLLNRQQFSFSYSRTNGTDVNQPFSFGENYNMQGQFDMSIQKAPGVKPLTWTKHIPLLGKLKETRIGLYPNSWRWAGTLDRSISVSDDINAKRTSSLNRAFDGRMDVDHQLLQNLNVKYAVQTRRDLTNPDQVKLSLKDWRLGLETSYSQSFGSTYDPKLIGFLGTGFTFQTTYSDTYERTTQTRKSDLNRTWSVSGQFRHQQLLSPGIKGSESASASAYGSQRPNYDPDAAKKKKKSEKVSKPFYDPPFAVLRFFTGWIEPIQYRYGETYTNSLPGMLERPEWQYRIGFVRTTDVATTRESRNPAATQGRNIELTSGFRFLGGIATNVGFKRAITEDLVRVGSLSKRTSTSFPTLDIRISKFSKLPLVKGPVNKFIDIFAPRTGFNREVEEEFDLTGGFRTDRGETKDYNPLLGVNFKLFRALSLSASYQLNKQRSERFNSTNGILDTDTRSVQRSITVTSRYSFRAPSGFTIPIFGKVKVTSTMNLEVNVRKGTTASETSRSGGPFIKADNKSDMMISPIISYDFSQQIKGGLTAQWQDTKDNNRKSHTRMLQVWAEIRF